MDIRRIFPSKSEALRPRLACEIGMAGVVAARPGAADQEILTAYAPLPPGTVAPGLKTPNLPGREAAVSALRQALGEVAEKETQLTLVIPDAAVRVLLLDFDTLPAKPAEALPIVRFRLRKLVPFEVEDAAVSYQLLAPAGGLARVLAAIMPRAVVSEYEDAVREAGYQPGAVLPSTLAALASVAAEEPSLLINCDGAYVTTAITNKNELLLHRTLETSPDNAEPQQADELLQAVDVAIAYFEDTLQTQPRQMLVCGPEGAAALAGPLARSGISAREAIPLPPGAGAGMPRGVLAGVVGALAS